MTRILNVPPVVLLMLLLPFPAAAQDGARGFPLGKPFKAISISGFDVQNAGITFAVAPEAQSNRLVGSGSAGCNTWTATVVLREDQIDIVNIVTTRKSCGKPRMTTEEAFLTSLRTTQRWRLDDRNRLILEGEAARLLLTGAGPGKTQDRKSDRKPPPAEKPARR